MPESYTFYEAVMHIIDARMMADAIDALDPFQGTTPCWLRESTDAPTH